jgi:hypothetical protein
LHPGAAEQAEEQDCGDQTGGFHGKKDTSKLTPNLSNLFFSAITSSKQEKSASPGGATQMVLLKVNCLVKGSSSRQESVRFRI